MGEIWGHFSNGSLGKGIRIYLAALIHFQFLTSLVISDCSTPFVSVV